MEEVNWNSSTPLKVSDIEKIFKDCPNLEAINYRGKRIELSTLRRDTYSLDDTIKGTSAPQRTTYEPDTRNKNTDDFER